eukprot:1206112-Rhodomonas_salina.2
MHGTLSVVAFMNANKTDGGGSDASQSTRRAALFPSWTLSRRPASISARSLPVDTARMFLTWDTHSYISGHAL